MSSVKWWSKKEIDLCIIKITKGKQFYGYFAWSNMFQKNFVSDKVPNKNWDKIAESLTRKLAGLKMLKDKLNGSVLKVVTLEVWSIVLLKKCFYFCEIY